MSKRIKTLFGESALLNSLTYQQYVERLTELSISMFDWTGLPDGIDVPYMERKLLTNGKVIFFEDDILNQYLALPLGGVSGMNVYNIPIERQAHGSNSYISRALFPEDSVIIYNNLLRTNSLLDIELFARKLSDLDRTIEINCRAQKTPVIVMADNDTKLSLENLYMQYDGNQPYIFTYKKDVGTEPPITALRTDAPFVADKLLTVKTQIWNEALTYLGIANTNYQKRERLISDEVLRSQGGTIACRYSRLKARQKACEEINKMFNLDIWCEFSDDHTIIGEEDVIKNEQIYNGSSMDNGNDSVGE